jgi:hypothetical protein
MPLKFDLRHGRRRLRLTRPAPGFVTLGRVDIVDVSVDGLGIESEFKLEPGTPTFLEFKWGNFPMRLSCFVARCRPSKTPGRWQIGLTIKKSSSPSIQDYTSRVEAALEKMREAEAKLPPLL